MTSAVETLSRVGIVSIFQILSSVIILVVGIGVGLKKFYDTMQKWRTHENQKEDEKETIEERLTKLENEDKEQLERLDNIDATLQNIVATLEVMTEDNRATAVATCRSAIYRWYVEFQDKASITSAEYEMFMDLANRYLACNGNSVFKDKIIPYVKNMKIID